MSDQFRSTIRQSFDHRDAIGADLPMGLFSEFNKAYEDWEIRRGFRSKDEKTKKPLRGSALTSKISSEQRKKSIKNLIKKKKIVNTKFTPDIVGKIFSSNNNAQRKIKQFIEQNILDIPSDYEFKVKKLDWGKYEITGSRALTPNKKSRKVVPV